MSIPILAGFFRAILVELSRHATGLRRRDIHEPVADSMQLLGRNVRSGSRAGAPRYRHRIGWGLNMLKGAGYVESQEPGSWKISSRGCELLTAHPGPFDDQLTKRITRESRVSAGADEQAPDWASSNPPVGTQQTPEERIDLAIREMRDSVARELLERIGQARHRYSSSDWFWICSVHLATAVRTRTCSTSVDPAMAESTESSLDRLGFEKIYVQAKRWQGSVGSAGSTGILGGARRQTRDARRIFTSSTFTRAASDFGDQVAHRIVLTDGRRLASLMIERGVGVAHRTVSVPRLDAEYFDAE